MKANLFMGKSKRTKIFTFITTASIVVLLAVNLFLSVLVSANASYIDLTMEGLYSLSDEMKSECDEIFKEIGENDPDKKVKVIFCTDPDYLTSAATTRLTYFMALKLEKRYPELFEVETVNVALNPTAVARYKTTSLTKIGASNIIFAYGDRYRVVGADGFWAKTSYNSYYNGEYRMASLILSVTAITQPVAYFLTGHGETYYDPENPESEMSVEMASFADLLMERGLKIKTLDLSSLTERRIPEDCALLIINNPTTDFTYDPDRLDEFSYVSDAEILDRYLVMNQGAIMVAKDYSVKLPVLESFLYEWGFSFGDTIVKDETSSLDNPNDPYTDLVAEYSTNPESYAYAIYGSFADLATAPVTVFDNAGPISSAYLGSKISEAGAMNATRTYASFITTSEGARLYYREEKDGVYSDYLAGTADKSGKYDLAAVVIREEIDQIANEATYSYVFGVNSPEFFSSSYLSDPSYANFDIVSAVVDNISRIDKTASMDLGGLSGNSSSTGGKMLVNSTISTVDEDIYSNKFVDKSNSGLGYQLIKHNYGITNAEIIVYSVIIMAVPVAIAALGVVVFIKRKNL